jgi:hypothetical protein
VPEEAGLLLVLPPDSDSELALGALGGQPPTAEDHLERLRDLEQALLPRWRVHQTVVHMHERAPAQRARRPRAWDPARARIRWLRLCNGAPVIARLQLATGIRPVTVDRKAHNDLPPGRRAIRVIRSPSTGKPVHATPVLKVP